MIRRWIIAVELSLLRDHLIHDEGQLFSNGVQIIIVEGGCRHFELLHWKHKVSKELATCRDKIAIIEYIYLTTIKPLKEKKEKEQSKLMQPSNYLLKKQQNSKKLISNRPT